MNLVLSNSKNKIGPISFKKILKISEKTSPLPNDQSGKEIVNDTVNTFRVCCHVYNTLCNSVSDNFFRTNIFAFSFKNRKN